MQQYYVEHDLVGDKNANNTKREQERRKEKMKTVENSGFVLVYRPLSLIPEVLKVDNQELLQTVKELCQGYESVSIAKLHEIHQGAVFICSDDFSRLNDKRVNLVGTYLYAHSVIMGTICIVKAEYDEYGEIAHVGFSESAATQIRDNILTKTSATFK